MIEVEDLTKYFGATLAVNHVSFRVEKGEIIGLLGPNGSGKTTIMRILTGFFPPTSGRALIGGLDVAEHSLETRRRVGYLPENMVLYPALTVSALLEFGARVRELDSKTTRERIGFSLETCGLKDVRLKLIGKLSKGYRQRVGIAQAILSDPEVLILDEPTVGLDPQVRQELWALIDALRAEGTTILMSTHYIEEAQRLADTVLIMSHGSAVAAGRPAQLVAEHAGREAVEVYGPPERLAEVEAEAQAQGLRTRRTGTSIAILGVNGAEAFQGERRPANLEDVFVLLTGEEID
jgi:lipooligosaccharide transport system ATP-binding protein